MGVTETQCKRVPDPRGADPGLSCSWRECSGHVVRILPLSSSGLSLPLCGHNFQATTGAGWPLAPQGFQVVASHLSPAVPAPEPVVVAGGGIHWLTRPASLGLFPGEWGREAPQEEGRGMCPPEEQRPPSVPSPATPSSLSPDDTQEPGAATLPRGDVRTKVLTLEQNYLPN